MHQIHIQNFVAAARAGVWHALWDEAIGGDFAAWRGPEQAAGARPGGRPPGGPNGVRGGSPLS